MKTFKTIQGAQYYKYKIEQFQQPTLTANNVLQNGFQVDNYYYAYYPNTGYICAYWDESVGWIYATMYCESPVLATQFTFDCLLSPWASASSAAYYPQLWGSHNGVTWDFLGQGPTVPEYQSGVIPSNTTTYYNYFQFRVRQGGWAHEDELTVANLRLWGSYKTLIPGTSTDYDVIAGQYKIQAFKLDKKYYMVKGDY